MASHHSQSHQVQSLTLRNPASAFVLTSSATIASPVGLAFRACAHAVPLPGIIPSGKLFYFQESLTSSSQFSHPWAVFLSGPLCSHLFTYNGSRCMSCFCPPSLQAELLECRVHGWPLHHWGHLTSSIPGIWWPLLRDLANGWMNEWVPPQVSNNNEGETWEWRELDFFTRQARVLLYLFKKKNLSIWLCQVMVMQDL